MSLVVHPRNVPRVSWKLNLCLNDVTGSENRDLD